MWAWSLGFIADRHQDKCVSTSARLEGTRKKSLLKSFAIEAGVRRAPTSPPRSTLLFFIPIFFSSIRLTRKREGGGYLVKTIDPDRRSKPLKNRCRREQVDGVSTSRRLTHSGLLLARHFMWTLREKKLDYVFFFANTAADATWAEFEQAVECSCTR